MPNPTKNDPAAVDAANAATAQADAEAAAAADTDANTGKLVVLMRGFIARTDAKEKTLTRRYRLGDEFEPVDGIHDVESLIAQRVLGRVGDGKLVRTTALSQAQAQAVLHDEDSPVVDLEFQPFTQTDVSPAHPDLATAGVVAGGEQADLDTSNGIDPLDLTK